MARFLPLGLTLFFSLATCFFVFETKSKIGDLSQKADSASGEVDGANQRAATNAAKEKTAEDKLAKLTQDTSGVTDKLQAMQSQLDAANANAAALSGSVTDLQTKLTAAQNSQPPPPPPGPSPEDMAKLTAQLKDALAQVSELSQVEDTLKAKEKDAETRADGLQTTVDHYVHGAMRNGLTGEVLAVNAGWNFVVLSIGDRQGAVTNAEMILQRGGSQIGKVRITSVEPSTSVADIIPGSLARGVKVEPGDQVIFPGT